MSQSPPTPFFTPIQRKVIAWALCGICLAIIIFLIVFVFYLLAGFLAKFSNLIGSLALAGITAMILRPLVDKIEKWTKCSTTLSVTIIYTLTVLVALLTAWLVIPALITQSMEFAKKVPSTFDNALASLALWRHQNQFISDQEINTMIETIKQNAQTLAYSFFHNLSTAGTKVLTFFGFLAAFAVIPVYLFYFLRSKDDPIKNLERFLPFLKEETRQDVIFLIREFITINVAFFRGQLVIGLLMGICYAIGFSISGLSAGLFIGLLLGLLNVIPYLGSIIGVLIVVPTGLFQEGGGWTLLFFCALTAGITQLLESWYFTPKIMGKQTGLHPVVIIISVFFWGIALGGILGMLMAIPLTAFLVTFWRLIVKKYIKPIV